MDTEKLLSDVMELVVAYAPKVALAVVTLIVGFWLTKRFVKFIDRRLEKRNVDPSLRPFLKSVLSALFKTMIVISVAAMVGIAATSFIAVLGAAGLAVGLALQGSLANFAGGVLILAFRPFKVGDVIEAGGYLGEVTAIQIFNTVLLTPDNRTVVIPNGQLSTGSLINYTAQPIRRVDLTFGVSHRDNIEKVRTLIQEVISADERILRDPKPDIFVGGLAAHEVKFTVRVWTDKNLYWDVFFAMHERVKLAFDAHGISIPVPQMDVHTGKA